MGKRDLGILIALAAMWGASYLFIRIASPVLGPVVLMDARVLLAGGALAVYALAARRMPSFRGRWRAYLLLGAVNAALPLTLIALAELRLPASFAAMLNATTPLFTAVVAAVWLKDRLTAPKVAGLLLGLVGVGLLVGWSSLPLSGGLLISAGASLLAALGYAVGSVYASRSFKSESPLALSIGQQFAAGAILLPLAVTQLPHAWPSTGIILAFLALSLMSTSLAYLLYFHLIQSVGATKTISVTFLVPGFGLLWGVLFLRETVTPGTLVGLATIWVSIVLITGVRLRPTKQLPAPSPTASTSRMAEVGKG